MTLTFLYLLCEITELMEHLTIVTAMSGTEEKGQIISYIFKDTKAQFESFKDLFRNSVCRIESKLLCKFPAYAFINHVYYPKFDNSIAYTTGCNLYLRETRSASCSPISTIGPTFIRQEHVFCQFQ